MTIDTRLHRHAEIPLDLGARQTRSAQGTIIAIHHQGARVLLLLDSSERLPLTLAEDRRIIEQTKKNIVGWVARSDGATLTLVEQVKA